MPVGRSPRRAARLVLSVIAALAACSPLPERSPEATPGQATPTAFAYPSVPATTASPDPCNDESITVIDGRSPGRDAILGDLRSLEPLGMDAAQLRERWNGTAASGLRLGQFETVLLTGSDDRHLQGEIGVSPGNERQITMLAPIDDSDQVRAVAVKWRLPLVGEETADPNKLEEVLASLVRSTAAPGRPSHLSSCVLRRLGSFDAESDFAGVDRQVLISSESIAYRLLDVGSVIWFTASRSGS